MFVTSQHLENPMMLPLYRAWPVNYGRVFMVPCIKWLVQCTLLCTCTLDKYLFPNYQNNTAMFNWSLCMARIKSLDPSAPSPPPSSGTCFRNFHDSCSNANWCQFFLMHICKDYICKFHPFSFVGVFFSVKYRGFPWDLPGSGADTDILPGGARFSTRAKRAEIFFVHPL